MRLDMLAARIVRHDRLKARSVDAFSGRPAEISSFSRSK